MNSNIIISNYINGCLLLEILFSGIGIPFCAIHNRFRQMLSRPTEEASAPQRHVVGMRSVLVPALADLVVLQIITAGPARTSSYAADETSRSVRISGASLKSDQISAIPVARGLPSGNGFQLGRLWSVETSDRGHCPQNSRERT